jgi:hypothetical protein
MISKKKFHTINDLQKVQQLAINCPCEVAFHSPDHSVMVDAKSYIGMYALDFTKPIYVVSEDESFHAEIKNIGENVD